MNDNCFVFATNFYLNFSRPLHLKFFDQTDRANCWNQRTKLNFLNVEMNLIRPRSLNCFVFAFFFYIELGVFCLD